MRFRCFCSKWVSQAVPHLWHFKSRLYEIPLRLSSILRRRGRHKVSSPSPVADLVVRISQLFCHTLMSFVTIAFPFDTVWKDAGAPQRSSDSPLVHCWTSWDADSLSTCSHLFVSSRWHSWVPKTLLGELGVVRVVGRARAGRPPVPTWSNMLLTCFTADDKL
jgi:hypothetical protein